jgi:hypothetical protein
MLVRSWMCIGKQVVILNLVGLIEERRRAPDIPS